MQTVNDILESVATLSLDEQCFIVETLNKRIIELKRTHIIARIQEAEHNYLAGDVMRGNASDLIKAVCDD